MFTKESVEKLFSANKNKNFIISTNISVGRGINGVSFTTFYGHNEWEDRNSYSSKTRHNNCKIEKFDDDFIVLRNDVADEPYNSGVFTRHIPYECINCISFINLSKRFGTTL